jgi:hypothetical protein
MIKPVILCLLLLAGCGDGAPTVTSSDTATCRVVHMYGDSITRQAGQTIAQFLPCYTIINHGVDGSIARHMTIPKWDKEAVYTISYGANECLKSISAAEYRLSLNHILNASVGQKIVLEAPWRLVNPACSPRIDQYRAVVLELAELYNVPVAELDMNRDHDKWGIHLLLPHTTHRAKLLAAEIIKF